MVEFSSAPRVSITQEAARQFDALPLVIRARILEVSERSERWPDVSGVKALRGRLAGCYRIRTGDYRVQFRVREGKVTVERLGHRDGFYEK